MSDERFDKNIKQKLESLRPAFEESAWKKFRAAAPLPWYHTLFQDWGGWIFGGVASAAFLATLYFNHLQQKTNELLHEEISTIKTTQISPNKVDTVVIEKYLTDTIYIVKTIRQVVEVPVANYQLTATSTNQLPIISENPVDNDQLSTTTDKQRELIEGRIVSNQQVVVNRKQPIENKDGITKNNQQVTANVVGRSTEDNVSKVSADSNPIDKAGNVIREQPTLDKEKVEITDKPSVSDLVIPETKMEEVTKKKFQFPYVRTRVGLTSDYLGLKIPLVGPTTEFFFGYSNLSLSTGLLFSNPQENKYKLSRDFNQSTGKQFEEFYRDKFRPQQSQRRIEDITIRTSFIKMPVAFNYYINTQSNFDFMFTAGTRLNVSVFQDIQFESNLLTEQVKEKFEARPKPKIFNSLFYGMGLQYQKGRFVGQFTPYFDFRFRQNEYLTIPRTFGINVSVKYDLGRGL
jgi:hypothetical protein